MNTSTSEIQAQDEDVNKLIETEEKVIAEPEVVDEVSSDADKEMVGPSDVGKKKKISIGLSNFTSLESFESTIETEEEDEVELSDELLNEKWMDYAITKASPQLKVMLEGSSLSLVGGKEVLIEVPSELAKVRIQDEKALIEDIRALLGNNQMKLSFNIMETQENEEDVEKIPVTSKEKLEFMIEKNKYFEDLINKFSLRLED